MRRQYDLIREERRAGIESYGVDSMGSIVEFPAYTQNPSRFIKVGRKRIVYHTNISSSYHSGIVPGVVVKGPYKTEHGTDAVDVDPIEDSQLQTKVREHLQSVIPSLTAINFWDKS